MKRLLIFVVLVIVLAGCDVESTYPPPTPTEMVSPVPTPPVSPLPTPEAAAFDVEYKNFVKEDNQMSLLEVLGAIAAGGAVLGSVISFLFERFKWFQKLSADARFWVVGAISIGLPVIATALILYVPADVWVALEPFWKAIFAGGTAWLGSQLVHRVLK